MSQPDSHSKSQSFYSIDNSKSEFTFIEDPQPPQPSVPQPISAPLPINVQHILQKFDIRQSSAVELQQSDLVNHSFESVVSKSSKRGGDNMNLHDISAIGQNDMNELECSMCLQNQIDILSVPQIVSPEEMKSLHAKMDRLKHQQTLLRQQITLFQETVLQNTKKSTQFAAQIGQTNKFIKKKCEHDSESAPPFGFPVNQAPSRTQVTMKRQESCSSLSPRKEDRAQKKKHFDIKPNRSQTPSQKQANAKYKECSFNRTVTLYEDLSNEFRVQLKYQPDFLIITLTNFQKGQTNFIHAARVNQPEFIQKISEKIYYPLSKYAQKKFTLSLSIMLLIFEQGKQKQQGNLIKIEEIRSISVPLPINYFIQTRFSTLSPDDPLLSKLHPRLYLYQIDINYNADYAAYRQLCLLEWVKTKWISLRGGHRLIYVELGEIEERDGGFGVVFRIGTKEKDAQEAIDLIEYLCFMLAL